MPDFDITGANQFGGARLIEQQPQQVPVIAPEQQAQMMMMPQQQEVLPQTVGIDPAVAAKLFAPIEDVPYGY